VEKGPVVLWVPAYDRDMSAASHDEEFVAIAVPADVAAALDERVRSGEYATPGDVVRSGLRLLGEEEHMLAEPELDRWLRDVALPIAQATAADPSRSIPADGVRAHFAEKHARRA